MNQQVYELASDACPGVDCPAKARRSHCPRLMMIEVGTNELATPRLGSVAAGIILIAWPPGTGERRPAPLARVGIAHVGNNNAAAAGALLDLSGREAYHLRPSGIR